MDVLLKIVRKKGGKTEKERNGLDYDDTETPGVTEVELLKLKLLICCMWLFLLV